MLNIEEPDRKGSTALLQQGFRPFFLLAGLSAVGLMGLWAWVLSTGSNGLGEAVGPLAWHGHEMLFGYGHAVVAGFLLTAVHNWTGQKTTAGLPLALMAGLWLLARVGWSGFGLLPWWLIALADLLFDAWLLVALLQPVLRVRQWNQLGILSKVLLLLLANGLFYAGLFGVLADGVRMGLYLGLYVLVALVMTMGRRVIPFFIEKGVGCPFQAKNWRWLDMLSLVLFLVFSLEEVFWPSAQIGAVLALMLCLLHALRLWGWHHPGVWAKPLLWVLFVGYAWLVIGFALHALAVWLGWSPFLALHAFAAGGIGMVTIGMMARVALGHTGRSVFEPPATLVPVFLLLSVGALVRVFGPLLLPDLSVTWLGLAQLLWMLGFAGFLWIYAPILWRPRLDGRPG